MKILIACEYSGRVRDAFAARGHDAWSCDLLPSETPGNHYHGDIFDILYSRQWDVLIAHPPCTFMCNSGVRWLFNHDGSHNETRWKNMADACEFFLKLWNAPVGKIAIENPIMHKHAKKIIGVSQSQVIQPWQFGHGETKATCLWLKGLPCLRPTDIVSGREHRVHEMPPGPDRWKERSRTYKGIANAMADQWNFSLA